MVMKGQYKAFRLKTLLVDHWILFLINQKIQKLIDLFIRGKKSREPGSNENVLFFVIIPRVFFTKYLKYNHNLTEKVLHTHILRPYAGVKTCQV